MVTPFDPSTRHKLYTRDRFKWERQRHAIEGEDRVKSKDVRDRYIPKLSGQAGKGSVEGLIQVTTQDAYVGRACFLNATGRTVEGLVGAVLHREPEINWPAGDQEYLETIGYSLETLEEITSQALEEVIGIGRFGHLVDLNSQTDIDPQPYISTYVPESITDWETGLVDGRKRDIRVNLLESTGRMHTNEKRELESYRILRLGQPEPATVDEEKMPLEEFLAMFGLTLEDFIEGPVYFQEVWEEVQSSTKKDRAYQRTALVVPRSLGGVIWREIPWTFMGAAGTKPDPSKPLLLDLTTVNFSHFRNSADLEHGLHYTGLPQPWAAGFDFKEGELVIGSTAAWISSDPNAKTGYLEFTGAGLGSLKAQMSEKKVEMASLGARILEEQSTSGPEAANTVEMRQAGERSALAKAANHVGNAITRSLKFVQMFRARPTENVGVTLNTDFGVSGLTAEDLTALMSQVIGGVMSWDVYVHNLRRADMYPDGWTKEQEAESIANGPPSKMSTAFDRKPTAVAPPDDPQDDPKEDQLPSDK